jgi:multicomponent Na+:H+ antiporter subunit A
MDPANSALLAISLPFAGALVAPWAFRALGHLAAWPLSLFALAVLVLLAGQVETVSTGAVLQSAFAWSPTLGLSLSFRIDGLSLVFGLLISGIGTLIVLYSGGYLKGDPGQGRFFAFILMFMGSMLGVVLSDNLLMLFVFWEMTSFTSFLLIGYNHKSEASRRAALQALAVTGGGGLVLLAGLILLMQSTGQTDLSGLLALDPASLDPALLLLPMVLVIIGAFTKSAQFPFHFWLPNAMQAPTPVSAFLHSATMVKAGVYLLMRLSPLFGDMAAWQVILPVFGAITLVVGASLAMAQTDLKLMLAQTTVASLGLMVMLTGLGSETALKAAVLYLIAHALFKGALFMVAGIIDHETGTRDVIHLGGLGRAMPLTFAAGLLAALSMGGMPFFYGFLAKEEIYAALADGASRALLLLAAVIAGNALMFAIAFQVGFRPFAGAVMETPKKPHDGPFLLMAGPLVLSVLGLAAALLPDLVQPLFSAPMASAVAGKTLAIDLAVLPHWGLPLALSGLTVLLGLLAYRLTRPIRATMRLILATIGWGPDRGFDQFMSGLVLFSARLTRLLQPGRLEIYLTVTFIVLAAVLIIAPALADEWPTMALSWPDLALYEWAFMAIVVIGLVQVIVARTRLVAIVSLGIQGFAIAVLYLIFGAPDLSFTQFMVETLSVVILALVMTRLRLEPTDHRPLSGKIGDGLIAILCGAGFTALLLRVLETPFDRTLTDFFALHSKAIAHGSNVVNVIIVDFRGTDTLGEIAVVAITGLAILALIRLKAPKIRLADNNPDQEA